MGMESDQEIVQMVGRDPRFSASLLPSMEASVIATCFFFHVILFNLWFWWTLICEASYLSIERLIYFQECISEGVTTRQEALDYLEAKVQYFIPLRELFKKFPVEWFTYCPLKKLPRKQNRFTALSKRALSSVLKGP